jgi:hypothetical protein
MHCDPVRDDHGQRKQTLTCSRMPALSLSHNMAFISSDSTSSLGDEKTLSSREKFHPFPGFNRIALSTWEYSPPQRGFPSEKSSLPQLILLFSWTNAKPRHIEKYTSGYKKLYPQATIVMVTTVLADVGFRSSTKKQKKLQPAISYIIENYSECNILMHCFSDGGSNKAVEFCEAFQTRAGAKLPVSAIVLDSTPGGARFRNLCNGFKNSLPDVAIVRFIGMGVAVAVGGIFLLFGRENFVVARTRKRLNNDRTWSLKGMARCYIYSKKDELVSWEDVEEHAKESAGYGVSVQNVRFDTSSHCNHMKEDEVKYWKAVRDCWERRDVENQ